MHPSGLNNLTVIWNETPETHDRRMQWWRDAKFGMFIHWGVYASLFHLRGTDPAEWYSEWVRHCKRIPVADYQKAAREWNPRHYDPAEWVSVALAAGMEYMVFTAKHCDGFCMFDSRHTDFSIRHSRFGRDAMKELAEECRQQGMKIGWYYSQRDWDHPHYLPHYEYLGGRGVAQGCQLREWWPGGPTYEGWGGNGPKFASYWGFKPSALTGDQIVDCGCVACRRNIPIREERSAEKADVRIYLQYLKNQVAELLTQYGNTAVMWFDAQDHDSTYARVQDLIVYMHTLQPDIIINDRVGSEQEEGDYAIHEARIPAEKIVRDWEACLTMNGNWGFNPLAEKWGSAKEMIHTLCDVVSNGGNLLLNVGPDGDGRFPPQAVERLNAIGRWMKVNGEAIYGTRSWRTSQNRSIRYVRHDTTLYVLCLELPVGDLVLPEIRLKSESRITLLGFPDELVADEQGDGVHISLPEAMRTAMANQPALVFKCLHSILL